MTNIKLPAFENVGTIRAGRDVGAGYQRGWGLQFGDLVAQIRKDPLFVEADALARGHMPKSGTEHSYEWYKTKRLMRRMRRVFDGGNDSDQLTVVSEINRMNIFLILTRFINNTPSGAIVEFGSYKGGNALFMAKICEAVLPDTTIHCFDTFEGMPETDLSRDAHNAGDFGDVSYDGLLDIIDRTGLKNIKLIKGLFQDTAPNALAQIGPIALNHIDCDIYSAVAYSYDISRPYMVEGGYWVIDDALYASCIGATEAVEELIIKRDGRHCEQIYPQYVFRNL